MLLLGQNQFLVLVFIKTHYLYVTLPFHIQNDVIRNSKMYRNTSQEISKEEKMK